jgi:hypothetical protein
MKLPQVNRHVAGTAGLMLTLAALSFGVGWFSTGPAVHALSSGERTIETAASPLIWQPPAEIAPQSGGGNGR